MVKPCRPRSSRKQVRGPGVAPLMRGKGTQAEGCPDCHVRRIAEVFPCEPTNPNHAGEVAKRWRFLDGGGEFGIISSVTEAFCSSCNRTRLATDGSLYTCLFADRGYELDGSLTTRGKPGAMITDEALAIARVLRMIREGVVSCRTGEDVLIQADTVCIHGDQPKALVFAQRLRSRLEDEGVEVQASQER
jgi:hypothetical protein